MASAASRIPRQVRARKTLRQGRESRVPPTPAKLGEYRCSAGVSVPDGKSAPHPTVLIATATPEISRWLSSSLKRENYLLLEAQTTTEVLRFARFHSRPIQVLLMQDHLIDDTLAGLLARLRPGMRVVVIQPEDGQPSLSVARALDTVRQLMQPVQPIGEPSEPARNPVLLDRHSRIAASGYYGLRSPTA